MKEAKKLMFESLISLEQYQTMKEVELTPELKDYLNTNNSYGFIKGTPKTRATLFVQDLEKLLELSYNEGIMRMHDVMSNMDKDDIDVVYTQSRRDIKKLKNK